MLKSLNKLFKTTCIFYLLIRILETLLVFIITTKNNRFKIIFIIQHLACSEGKAPFCCCGRWEGGGGARGAAPRRYMAAGNMGEGLFTTHYFCNRGGVEAWPGRKGEGA